MGLARRATCRFLSLPAASAGDRLGRLRTHGPQELHGSCTNPIGGAGLIEHRDWLVQVVPTFLPGGPHASLPHQTGVPDLSGQLLRAPGGPVIGAPPPPPPPPFKTMMMMMMMMNLKILGRTVDKEEINTYLKTKNKQW